MLTAASTQSACARQSVVQFRCGQSVKNRRRRLPVTNCYAQDIQASASKGTVRVSLRLPYRVAFGQALGVVGAGGQLGNWNPVHAIPMYWTADDLWTADISIDARQPMLQLEYKYIVVDRDGVVARWKPGANFRVDVPVMRDNRLFAGAVAVQDDWDGSCKRVDVEVLSACGEADNSAAPRQAAWSAGAGSTTSSFGAAEDGPLAGARETAFIQQAADMALQDLKYTLGMHYAIMLRVRDPADRDLLIADRKLAAASSKLVAYSQALAAERRFARQPVTSR